MNVSIFGLGYIGCVMGACAAHCGHKVIGYDTDPSKMRDIQSGKPTVIENGLDVLVMEASKKKSFTVDYDVDSVVCNSDISLIAVGTPGTSDGHLSHEYIYQVSEVIGKALKKKIGNHTIVVCSTVYPGTNKVVGDIVTLNSGRLCGKDFFVISNPEFLREGTAINDFMFPPFILIGTDSEEPVVKMKEFYKNINSNIILTDTKVAEIMKYVSNSYHALKVTFANEIGAICKSLNIDGHEVMEIFCKDTLLNISSYYLKPGFAYGGSCLPKDTKALTSLAHKMRVDIPVLEAISKSNDIQKSRAIELIIQTGMKKIGILGISFKPFTDDIRCSPILDVAKVLLKNGYEVIAFDKYVSDAIKRGLYDFNSLNILVTGNLEEVLEQSEVLVIVNYSDLFEMIPEKYPDKIIVDLIHQYKGLHNHESYNGLN